MATFNLLRNSRVFFTTNFSTDSAKPPNTVSLGTGGSEPVFALANTQEIQVLDGFSFSQASNADTVTIAEAGATPVRGQRSFNTSLNNVEFTFSSYIRPRLATTLVKAEEAVLWNALLGFSNAADSAIVPTAVTCVTTTGAMTIAAPSIPVYSAGDIVVIKGVTGVGAAQYNTAIKVATSTATTLTGTYLVAPTVTIPVFGSWSAAKLSKNAWNENIAVSTDTTAPQVAAAGVAYSSVTSALSNKNQLLPFGMIITVDGVTYCIDNCAMDQASIDFGLDGIAMVAWTGKGTRLRSLATNVVYSAATDPVMSGGLVGTATGKITTANYITSKLSSVSLVSNIAGFSGTTYTLALTGGNISIANNITYVTPANLGTVNLPIGYFTGTRAISGSLNAYLRTGTNGTSDLLNNMLTNASTSVEPKFKLEVDIGGSTSPVRVELECRGAVLQIPTIDAQAVMSTSIAFTAQGSDNVASATAGYDIENTNDIVLRYLSN